MRAGAGASSGVASVGSRIGAPASMVAQAAFHLFLLISLTTPSWRYGLLARWPLVRFEELAGGPAAIGALSLLPAVVLAGWAVARLAGSTKAANLPGARLTLGPRRLVVPFAALTLLGLVTLQPEPFRRFFLHVGMFALAWLVYLYAINERPCLRLTLALILAIQGAVAIGQFTLQGDLGLVGLGELPLNPAFRGISVVVARGQPWLRAYGLTAHPNLLAAVLVAGLLLFLPTRANWRGAGRALFWAAAVLALLGLFLTFSRGGWLAFAAGLATWGGLMRSSLRLTRGHLWVVLAATAGVLVLLLLFGDLVSSRFFNLSAPTEAQSINQRLNDAAVALQIISEAPVLGVGLGNYLDAAVMIDPGSARVHNVPLFVTAELGLLGFAFWLWLMVAPFEPLIRREARDDQASRHLAVALAPWVAMLVANLFDTMLWLSSNWQTSILFALLLANVVRPVAVEDELAPGGAGRTGSTGSRGRWQPDRSDRTPA